MEAYFHGRMEEWKKVSYRASFYMFSEVNKLEILH